MSGDLKLVPGSRYHVRSVGTREDVVESRGTFVGYVSMASSQALVLELDDHHGDQAGTRRFIPVHMILAVDVLEQMEDEDSDEESHIHYG